MKKKEYVIEDYQSILAGCIARNLPLIMALQLEIEDVKQDLNIRLLRAIGRFDEERCKSITMYLHHELQYEILDMRRRHKPHGIVGVPKDMRLDTISLDQQCAEGSYVELPIDDYYDFFSRDILTMLSEAEQTVITRKIQGEPIRKKEERNLLERARVRLSAYFPERMYENAKATT